MTEPEPPEDLGLYRELELGDDAEEAPRSTRRASAAPPLAAEFGMEHLIDADLRPARNWSLWVRSRGPWIVAALLVLWLIASFALRQIAAAP